MTHSQEKTELRQRLLEADSSDSALRAQYERKVAAMFETQLSLPKRVWFSALVLFCIAAGAQALMLAVTEKVPPIVRAGFVAGAFFCLAWVVYLGRMLRRGTLRRRIDPPFAAGMGFVFAMIMCVIMAVAGMKTEQVILMGVLILLPAGLILIRTVIEQSELRTQERLVEIQYHLSRLAEKLDGDEGAGSGVRR